MGRRDVEIVLAVLPEQTWWFDLPVGGVDLPVEVPMRVRRKVVAEVVEVLAAGADLTD